MCAFGSYKPVFSIIWRQSLIAPLLKWGKATEVIEMVSFSFNASAIKSWLIVYVLPDLVPPWLDIIR